MRSDQALICRDPAEENWNEVLGSLVHVDLDVDAKELKNPAVRERHRIYCYLLMKLILRFWNGNKNGPFGIYPQRDRLQLEGPKGTDDTPRLSGRPQAVKPEGSLMKDRVDRLAQATKSRAGPARLGRRTSVSSPIP
jgi:hypothetical protein